MLKYDKQMTLDDISIYNPLYDILIAKDNFWRQMKDLVDFSFVAELIGDTYSANMGRHAEDVSRMFKFLLLKQYYKLSDVGVIERTLTDLNFKYFLDYKPEETKFIDPSLLTVFRRQHIAKYETDENGKRVKIKDSSKEVMDQLISITVKIAQEKGILGNKINMIVDSTHSNSIYGHISPREQLINEAKKLRKAVYEIDESMHEKMPKKKESTGLLEDQIEYTEKLVKLLRDDGRFEAIPSIREMINHIEETVSDTKYEIEYSKDEEAKVGHKTADTSFFGYKTHIAMDSETRIITAATITTGEKHDGKELQKLVEETSKNVEVEAVIGDGAYAEEDNLKYCEEIGIKNASKLSKTVLYGNRDKSKEFEYNKDAKRFVCPNGVMAYKVIHQKGNKHNNYSEVDVYHFDVEKCKYCPLKEGCYKEGAKSKTYSVTIKKDVHIKHMEYMKSNEYKELYSNRYKIEAKNAELKQTLGYEKANACGMSGMTIQGGTALFLANMKRIIKLSSEEKQENKE